MSYALHPLKLWLDCCWSIPLTCFHTYPRTWKVLWFILVFFGMHSNRKLIWEFEFTMNVTWSLVHEQHLVWYTQATHASSSTCNEQHQAGLMARNKRFFTYHYTYVRILVSDFPPFFLLVLSPLSNTKRGEANLVRPFLSKVPETGKELYAISCIGNFHHFLETI